VLQLLIYLYCLLMYVCVYVCAQQEEKESHLRVQRQADAYTPEELVSIYTMEYTLIFTYYQQVDCVDLISCVLLLNSIERA
jgi:hypothetical protein